MDENHKFTQSIIHSMKTLLEGEVRLVEKQNNWTVEVFVKWNKRRIQIILKSRKSNLKDKFVS